MDGTLPEDTLAPLTAPLSCSPPVHLLPSTRSIARALPASIPVLRVHRVTPSNCSVSVTLSLLFPRTSFSHPTISAATFGYLSRLSRVHSTVPRRLPDIPPHRPVSHLYLRLSRAPLLYKPVRISTTRRRKPAGALPPPQHPLPPPV